MANNKDALMLVVDATPEHIEQFLSKPIRQDDLDEWFAATGGRSVPGVMRENIKCDPAEFTRALLNDTGECICLWGVTAGPVCGEGIVWLIATLEAEAVGKSIHRFWPREVALMHMRHDLLAALAYAGNDLHASWLEAVGFHPIAVDRIGPSRLPFITYVRNMPSCATQ